MSVLPTHTQVLYVRARCWRSSGEGTGSGELELELVVAESTLILWKGCFFASVYRCEETL